MLFYKVVAYIVSVLLVALVGAIGWKICSKDRKERIQYIRQFKKGKGAMIYVIVIPLLIVGKMYDGVRFIDAFFEAIPESLSLIVLRFSFDSVGALMHALPVFATVVYIAYFLIIVNALLLTFSLFQQQMWTLRQKLRWLGTKKERLLLIGYNRGNIAVYKSEKKRMGIIIGNIPKAERDELYIINVRFTATKRPMKMIETVLSGAYKKKKRNAAVMVINLFDDEKSIAICREIIERIDAFSSESPSLQFFRQIRIFVYGDPKYEASYTEIEDASKGCITYMNKYRQIAIDFVDRYPLTRFLEKEQVDKETTLVSDKIAINALLLGFGKTNRQVFLTSVANNQFLERKDGKITLKKVNYYMFDRADARSDKNLNHSYYRFAEEMKNVDVNAYLPMPSEPANDAFYSHLDVNTSDFYETVRKIVTRNLEDANFILVAYGSDLENLDMAQKLLQKKSEWGVKNCVVFVKLRTVLADRRLFKRADCYAFGEEKECVYNIECIVGDKLFSMAMLRNRLYTLEQLRGSSTEIDEQAVFEQADLQWYMQKTQAERESNVYACLSLRSKLQLLGLDYVKVSEAAEGLTEKTYSAVYRGSDGRTTEGATSKREAMAIQEHYRWNAYMIGKGFIPATKERILRETKEQNGKLVHTNGRNYQIRAHGNLTTWEGLFEFRRMIAERDGIDELQADVIKYDFQPLDDAFRLLAEGGYKIIYR